MSGILCFEDILLEYNNNIKMLKKLLKQTNNNIKFYLDRKINDNEIIEIFNNNFLEIDSLVSEVNNNASSLKNLCNKKSQINLFKEKMELNEINKSYLIRLNDHFIYFLNYKFNNDIIINKFNDLLDILSKIVVNFIGKYYSEEYYRNLMKVKLNKNNNSFIDFEIKKCNDELKISLGSSDNSNKNSNFSWNENKNKLCFKISLIISLFFNLILLILVVLKINFSKNH